MRSRTGRALPVEVDEGEDPEGHGGREEHPSGHELVLVLDPPRGVDRLDEQEHSEHRDGDAGRVLRLYELHRLRGDASCVQEASTSDEDVHEATEGHGGLLRPEGQVRKCGRGIIAQLAQKVNTATLSRL